MVSHTPVTQNKENVVLSSIELFKLNEITLHWKVINCSEWTSTLVRILCSPYQIFTKQPQIPQEVWTTSTHNKIIMHDLLTLMLSLYECNKEVMPQLCKEMNKVIITIKFFEINAFMYVLPMKIVGKCHHSPSNETDFSLKDWISSLMAMHAKIIGYFVCNYFMNWGDYKMLAIKQIT